MRTAVTLALTAAAAALVARLAVSNRKPDSVDGILTLISPFIDSSVADEFLIDLERNRDRPLVVVIHTFGGLVIPCAQIARALLEVATVSVVVPLKAFSGGTLIALSADTVAMGEFACMSAVDPILGDDTRARHYAEIEDPLERIDAKEYFDAMMGLIEVVIERRKVPPTKRAQARALLSGEKYPHGWPLSRAMLADAGILTEKAAPFWSSALERFVHENFL